MPLRPKLYEKLKNLSHIFGDVLISHPDVPMEAVYRWDAVTQSVVLEVSRRGETYRVNCPFCGDRRHRLWINYLWGKFDPVTQSRNLWLCICYNETQCLKDPINRNRLYNIIFSDEFFSEEDNKILFDYNELNNTTPEFILEEAQLPGEVINITKLPDTHLACSYLLSRNFDPNILGEKLGLSYCYSAFPQYKLAQDRLIIPIYMNNKFVGWQARYLGDKVFKFIPKYWTMPGLRKSQVLYNFDVARSFPFVVVVEGVSDVWRFGPEAVSALGHELSSVQKNLLTKYWNKIVILFDGDVYDKTQLMVDNWIPSFSTNPVQICSIKLPENKDPADFSTSEIRQLVFSGAKQAGLFLEGFDASDLG
jgi:hypothetical protein